MIMKDAFKKKRDIKEIIVHCTATAADKDIGVADIDRYHRSLGWRGCGYHWVVRLDGTIEAGRPEGEDGAHCTGHNHISIGVAYCGGIDGRGAPADTRTAEQCTALRRLLGDIIIRYPGAKIHGHRDFAAKACPCFDATTEYADLCER